MEASPARRPYRIDESFEDLLGPMRALLFQEQNGGLRDPLAPFRKVDSMNWSACRAIWIIVAAGVSGVQPAVSQATRRPDSPAAASSATIEGLVRDISCAMQNLTTTAIKFNLECTRQCVKRGSPLVILGKDGTLFVPISGSTPDSSQRERLLPFVGKYVRVTGTVFERAGVHAIAINRIEELKGVHLITDAQ